MTIREGARIGAGVRVGTACDLQPEVAIGDHARLHSNVFAARGSVIEELTWLFPGAVLLDDPHPPSDECTKPPTIRRFAVIGARATIASGVEVGEGALVGAASLVREDVPPSTVVVGVPSREIGATADVVCRHGKLEQLYPWWLHFRRGYPDGVLPGAIDGSSRSPGGIADGGGRRPTSSSPPRKFSGAVTGPCRDDRDARGVGGSSSSAIIPSPASHVVAYQHASARARRASGSSRRRSPASPRPRTRAPRRTRA